MMNRNLRIASSTIALATVALSAPAFAQSTGSVDFENQVIVVSGTRVRAVDGVQIPDSPKAKQVLTQEVISQQNPGQTILDTINLVPGVSFQNNDAYGSSGGTLTIRGFDSSRISLTFDGIPLNDSGNYAIYSNQQLDPELIEQVNVNLGSTDVDSPTASAVGGTVNYRTITPSDEMGAMLSTSIGEYNFRRVFGMIQTGDFTGMGTKAFISASKATNDNPFNNYGKVDKQQYNARLWQDIGSNGDFIAIAGNYNENRNNFFGSLPLRLDADRTVGSGSGNRFPANADEREYNINYPCQTDVPQAGVADTTNTCGTEFDRRYNPSNTGNIRINSKFTLMDGLVLTVDPSFQYVKANGGGTVIGREGVRTINGVNYTGFIGGQYYFGTDLNGDGDTLDTCSPAGSSCSSRNYNGVNLLAPSQTRTRRYGVIANLRWDINADNTVRLSYTHDYANHRQTGQLTYLYPNGEPFDVFPVNDPIKDVNGTVVQKRDRQSLAILDQVAGEYRGKFGGLVVNLGVRAPFFKRDLNNYCFTTSASGFVDCLGTNATLNASYAAANPTVQGPQRRVLNYNRVLPNVGFTYSFTPAASVFASYSKNLSVPGTDNLYNAFYFPANTPQATPKPETTDSFDLGLRYRTGKLQAQLSGWYTKFKNRTASAYDPVLDTSVFRNLGDVDKYGVDGSFAWAPIEHISLYAFGSYMWSEIKDNVQVGVDGSGNPIYAQTAGKRESGEPIYTFGGSARGSYGPLELGVTAKRTGARYIFDTNLPTYGGPAGTLAAPNLTNQVYGAKAAGYWLVNLDARFKLDNWGLKKSYFQLNVYNLFDQFYVGGFGGGLTESISSGNWSPGFVQIGAPRTVSGTMVIAF